MKHLSGIGQQYTYMPAYLAMSSSGETISTGNNNSTYLPPHFFCNSFRRAFGKKRSPSRSNRSLHLKTKGSDENTRGLGPSQKKREHWNNRSCNPNKLMSRVRIQTLKTFLS